MNNNDFSEILNNSKDLTIGQIFKLITKITYKSMVLFVTVFLTITGSAYFAGQANVKQETAVMLYSPFSMRIIIDGNNRDFENLTLVEDPTLPRSNNKTVVFSLRQIQSAFDTIQIGQVIAQFDDEQEFPVWEWIFSSVDINTAYAQPNNNFKWSGHEKDFKFREKQKNSDTIHRYYSDGCILEYRLDKNNRSIPKSFHWIKNIH